jgi:hypothetical protein
LVSVPAVSIAVIVKVVVRATVRATVKTVVVTITKAALISVVKARVIKAIPIGNTCKVIPTAVSSSAIVIRVCCSTGIITVTSAVKAAVMAPVIAAVIVTVIATKVISVGT